MSAGSAPPQVDATIGARLGVLVLYVPLVGFVVDLAIRLASGVDDWKQTALDVGVLWLIGITGFILASGHLFMPAPTAASIGWAASPFQWEVGLANLAYGVLGVTATSFDRDYTLAAIVSFSIYLLGAAAGHVRSMVHDHNFAPGNTGYVFWFDILAPVLLIVLYIATG
ncbi:MAG: DUF6790 family protein [Candidatus Limnocylindrales bacterium]